MGFLALIPNTLKIAAVGLLAAVLAFGTGYVKGRTDMRATARAEAIQATLDQLKERNATDAEVNALDAPGICAAIGGEWVPDAGCQ